MPHGTVKWFSASKGFGFLTPADGGVDLFFHRTHIEGPGESIRDHQPVEFELGDGRKGTQAVAVRAS